MLLSQLGEFYYKEFGDRLEMVFRTKSLHSKILSFASHIARIKGKKWLIWYLPSCKYPTRKVKFSGTMTTNMNEHPAQVPGHLMRAGQCVNIGPLRNDAKHELQQDLEENGTQIDEHCVTSADNHNGVMAKQEGPIGNVSSSNISQNLFESVSCSNHEHVLDELQRCGDNTFIPDSDSNEFEENMIDRNYLLNTTDIHPYKVHPVDRDVTSGVTNFSMSQCNSDTECCSLSVPLFGHDTSLTGSDDLEGGSESVDDQLTSSDSSDCQANVEFNLHPIQVGKEDKDRAIAKIDSNSFDNDSHTTSITDEAEGTTCFEHNETPNEVQSIASKHDNKDNQPKKRLKMKLAIQFPKSCAEIDHQLYAMSQQLPLSQNLIATQSEWQDSIPDIKMSGQQRSPEMAKGPLLAL